MLYKHFILQLFIIAQVLIHNTKCEPMVKNISANKACSNSTSISCKSLRGSIKGDQRHVYESKFNFQSQIGLTKIHKSGGKIRNPKRRRKEKSLIAGTSHLAKNLLRRKTLKKHRPRKKGSKINTHRSHTRSNRRMTHKANQNKQKSVPKTNSRKINKKVAAVKKGPKKHYKAIRKKQQRIKKSQKTTQVRQNKTKGLAKTNSSFINRNSKRNTKKNISLQKKAIPENNEHFIVNEDGKCVKVQNYKKKVIRYKRTKVSRKDRPRMKRMIKRKNEKNRRRSVYKPKQRKVNLGNKKVPRHRSPVDNKRLLKLNGRKNRVNRIGTHLKSMKANFERKVPHQKLSSQTECELYLHEFQNDAPATDDETRVESSDSTGITVTKANEANVGTTTTEYTGSNIRMKCVPKCFDTEEYCYESPLCLFDSYKINCELQPEPIAKEWMARKFNSHVACSSSPRKCRQKLPDDCGWWKWFPSHTCDECTEEGAKSLIEGSSAAEKEYTNNPEGEQKEIAIDTNNADGVKKETAIDTNNAEGVKKESTIDTNNAEGVKKETAIETNNAEGVQKETATDPKTSQEKTETQFEPKAPTPIIESKETVVEKTATETIPKVEKTEKPTVSEKTAKPVSVSVTDPVQKPVTEKTQDTKMPSSPPTKPTQAHIRSNAMTTPVSSTQSKEQPLVVIKEETPEPTKPSSKPPIEIVQPERPTSPTAKPSVIVTREELPPVSKETIEESSLSTPEPVDENETITPEQILPSTQHVTRKKGVKRKRPVDECWFESGPYAGKCVNVKRFLKEYGSLPVKNVVQDPGKLMNTFNDFMHMPVKDSLNALNRGLKSKGNTMESALYFGKTVTSSTACRFIMEKAPVSNGFLYSLAEPCKRIH